VLSGAGLYENFLRASRRLEVSAGLQDRREVGKSSKGKWRTDNVERDLEFPLF
jgi:hypothetical protein